MIDRSGSMRGQRITQAKVAATLAVEQLEPHDIVSIIAYDTEAELLVPATKVKDKEKLLQAIQAIEVAGSTALYAGTQLGGEQVRHYLDRERVNRVILLSDGIANVGPSSVNDLYELGQSLGSEGIAVSTIGLGLGYNEDLMAQLAASSDGNHAFVEHPDQLAHVMRQELKDALAVVAQDIKITVTFADGVYVKGSLGREAKIHSKSAVSRIKQMISKVERFVLLELEITPQLFALNPVTNNIKVADIRIEYLSLKGKKAILYDTVIVSGAQDEQDQENSTQAEVMASVVELKARERETIAISLKDAGKDDEAAAIMEESSQQLAQNAQRYRSKKLQIMSKKSKKDSVIMKRKGKGRAWKKSRKSMRQEAYSSKAQMAY